VTICKILSPRAPHRPEKPWWPCFSRAAADKWRNAICGKMYELVSLVNCHQEGSYCMSTPVTSPKKTTRGTAKRTQDPEGTRQNIIEIAAQEFALNGLAGARIDDIAAKTRSSKRMIYYYFGDKEGLYVSCLENAYRQVREGEAKLDVGGLSPIDALKKLVEFTFDHHHQHQEFIRMVMIENIHNAQYLERSGVIRDLNVTAIGNIETICAKGLADGMFRSDLDPLTLHWQISALCFFNVSNRATFSKIFGQDYGADDVQVRLRQQCVEMILRYVVRTEKLGDI
jgi:AcrR family transcriptional regulator